MLLNWRLEEIKEKVGKGRKMATVHKKLHPKAEKIRYL